ncbi:hypothetical protein CCR85_11545 [Rhodothalassium salexigens]|uniref:Uncharacterized protein DUF3126 n=1 Tax=Rhodothalassium salexigens DSM 2132 TaxID=1188247 RepID=A0A4R2PQ16_RHOSA|nr:DUF3126 family protein [Rhodothalassium salexigens]MBB4211041.1 ribosomal protein S11 [Rhodothalassium salexigens DSM 2132]MBK1637955.1 hypothetical protein [Rhodothalassium salexigens DSM 2132]MBK5912121.1 hypothetical protein [Rhodothalassium salexigens]MBK5921800.1 hypothetical protein [Rhodothalassium salexigens]TCP36301.1 uncharacterized protein DUF3126 [Rhodothalassium salexigens DSM 2132]
MTQDEIGKLVRHLRQTFNNDGIKIAERKQDDSVEVTIDGEFIGVIYKDEEEGETSYAFNMAILDIDLEDA